MAWSADGRHVLLYMGSLRVWEVTTGQLIARLDDGVPSAAFSADGAHVVTGDGGQPDRARSVGRRHVHLAHPRRSPDCDRSTGEGARHRFARPRRCDAGSDRSELASARLRLARGARADVRRDVRDHAGLGAQRRRQQAVFQPDAGPFRGGQSRAHGGVSTGRESIGVPGQVALSPDEQRVAVVFPDSVRILDAATLAPLATIPAGAGMSRGHPTLGTSPRRPISTTGTETGRRTVPPRKSPSGTPRPDRSGAAADRDVPAGHRVRRTRGDGRGLGYPTLTVQSSQRDTAGTSFSGVTTFAVDGDAASFAIFLATSTLSPSNLPPYVGATRELVATEDAIVALSTGTTLAAIPDPAIGRGVFSPDFSVLLTVDRAEGSGDRNVRVVGVANGATIADIPLLVVDSRAVAGGLARRAPRRHQRRRGVRPLIRYASFLTTETLIVAFTPRPSLTATSKSPSALIGSARWIFFESTVTPFSCSASAMSRLVTEP